ncbi:PAS domain S-box protein [Candidatus Binatia bacterium]|nr:PAS domain S-box protein [Candidatus Binatia bacterium]
MDGATQLDAPRRRAVLDQAMYERLVPAAGVVAILYLAYAVAHALGLEAEVRKPIIASTTISAALLLALDRAMRRGRVPVGHTAWLGAGMTALMTWNCTLYLGLTGEPSLAIYVGIVFVGTSLVVLSWPLLAFTFVCGWSGFLWTASFTGPNGIAWQHVAVALATTTALGVVVHAARIRSTLLFEQLRARDRARAEELEDALRSLAESEQRHRDLVENDLGIILKHDLAGRILAVNPAAAATLGRDAGTLVGADLDDVLAASFRPQLAAYLERARVKRRDTGTMRVSAPHGRERLWDYVCVLVEERARPPVLLLHAHDITERVRLAERLRAARSELQGRVRARTLELEAANAALREEIDQRRRIGERLLRYGQALEACSDAIILADLDGTIVDVNGAAVGLCAASGKDELIGGSLVELAAAEDRARAAQGFAEVLGGVGGPPQEFLLLQRSGDRVPVEAALAVVRDADGQPCALVSVGRDVTWRRQMESTLRHNEAYLRTLLENSTDTILVLDVDGTLLARPNSADRPIGRFGYSAEQLLGRFGHDFLHADDVEAVLSTFVRVTRSPGGSAAVECRVRDGAGSFRPGQIVFCNLLADPTVAGVMCSVRDLTDQKRAEAELREARDAAEAASQAKTEFLNTMSHELRTPIHAVLGYAEMLIDGAFGALTAEQREAVQRITDRARDQFELIAAVLDLSAMEAGRMTLQAGAVRLAELCAEIEREGRKAWTESGLTVAWDVPVDLPALESDAAKIKIVLRNLVSNAVKFTAQGSVTTRARVLGDGVEISVSDTGIGIPAAQRDAIFAPFFQVDGSESRRYEGSGLGLHIVKRLLDLLDGRVTVESEVGRGSTFRVWLPRCVAAASAPPIASALDAAPAARLGIPGC